MKMRLSAKRLISILVLMWLPGCSFHSSQYHLIKGFFTEGSDGPTAAWEVVVNGTSTSVFAVQRGNEILFVDRSNLFIRFDGWQIVEARNVTALNGDVTIDVSESEEGISLTYRGGQVFADQRRHRCGSWVAIELARPVEGASSQWSQACRSELGGYENKIWLDDTRLIRRLDFLVSPGMPGVTIRLRS